MLLDQFLIIAVLMSAVALFIWGRWRHDMVALAALLLCVAVGVVPAAEAFVGFGHPAVITVACILVLSQGLQSSGAIDAIADRWIPTSTGPFLTIAALTILAALLSAFMNNVGALALLMPVALQLAARQSLPPGRLLMPLAFGSILGGMTTLIGTPPNLIVSSFRQREGVDGFAMFDFAQVGVPVAAVGVLFIVILGWRLVPTRKGTGVETFDTGTYLTEARVPERGKVVGLNLREIDTILDDVGAQVVGLVRKDVRIVAPTPSRIVQAGDILVIESEPKMLTAALSVLNLKLEESKGTEPSAASPGTDSTETNAESDAEPSSPDPTLTHAAETVLRELAVLPNSSVVGRSATEIDLRTVFSINLLALSRQGDRSTTRLRTTAIEAGDVLLMQGTEEAIARFASQYGCVPLAERALRLPDKRRAWLATLIMAGGIASAALGIASAAISFTVALLATMVFRVIPPRRVYDAIDWPVIVLLGAMIPVADAMATTGTADLIAQGLLEVLAQGNAVIALVVVLIVTMTLSDFMNNAATAAVMCPIAISTANTLSVNPDPFLMAVAVGASCAFLTPIGHQNNTLILGPGGFRFGDYWRLGLAIELIVLAVGIPMILQVWPLG
jgi:di/tricarboxylate transporter